MKMVYLIPHWSSGNWPIVSIDNSDRGCILYKWWSTRSSQFAGLCHFIFSKIVHSVAPSFPPNRVQRVSKPYMSDRILDVPRNFSKTASPLGNLFSESSSWALNMDSSSSSIESLSLVSWKSISDSSIRKMSWVILEAIPHGWATFSKSYTRCWYISKSLFQPVRSLCTQYQTVNFDVLKNCRRSSESETDTGIVEVIYYPFEYYQQLIRINIKISLCIIEGAVNMVWIGWESKSCGWNQSNNNTLKPPYSYYELLVRVDEHWPQVLSDTISANDNASTKND